MKNVKKKGYIRAFRIYGIVLTLSTIIFGFQNCAPVGETIETVQSLGDPANPGGPTGPTPPPAPGVPAPLPPPAGPMPPLPPDPCLGNLDPELFGERVGNSISASISSRNAWVGIQEGSGTVLPSDIVIVGSPGVGETQVLSLSCDTTGNAVDVDCDNNGFNVRDGQYRATVSINQRNNSQCSSGTVTVTLRTQDTCNAQSPNELSFTVNVADGCLPERKKVAWNDGSVNAKFGYDIDMTNQYAVVAAPGDDENGNSAGAAYVFRKDGADWVLEQKLMISDSADPAWGEISSVAIDGTTIVLGAPYHEGRGGAFVFKRNSGTWTQTQKLSFTGNSTGGDNFGIDVDIDGAIIVVGANHDKSVAVQAGAAHIYRWANSSYAFEQKITAPNAAARQQFGNSVAVSGGTIVVGAPVHLSYASTGSGSAHVFTKPASTWTGTKLAYNGRNGDRFGESVGIDGGRIVIGAPKAVNGNNNARNGIAMIYRGSSWADTVRLAPGGTTSFGTKVAIDGAKVIVGAPRMGGTAGGAYYFVVDGSNNEANSKFLNLARDRRAEDQFGQGVAVNSAGDTAIGAWIDDLRDTETGTGNPIDNAGSVYFIELP